MRALLDEVSQRFKVYKGKGVPESAIVAAEQQLGVTFSEQYKTYLKECGVLSFGTHEFMGLGVDGYLNVVDATREERRLGGAFPRDCILIENVGVDGVLMVMDSSGVIYACQNGEKVRVADSFFDYLKSL